VIATLVLDLDGPLLDGRQRHYRCYSDILRGRGHEPLPLEQYWTLKRSRVDRRRLLSMSDAIALYDDFLAEWLRLIETREYLALDRLQDGVIGILQGWKQDGRRLLLATMRHNRANLQWQLDTLGLSSYLDAVLMIAGEGAAEKAAAVRPLLGAATAERAAWIGDTEIDIQAARSLDMRCCAVACGLRTEDYLASLSPDALVPDLTAASRWLAQQD
jgi:phosphoglycolate phosphatase-like HAD superfamily hydrolase